MSERRAKTVAIITDGNGRWANDRSLPVVEGHRAGADTVKARLRDCVELGVEQLTVYSFSTENWGRSAREVRGLMKMFDERLQTETPELLEEGVRMRFIGDRTDRRIPTKLVERMGWAEELTSGCERIELFVAFNYGSRNEIFRAAEKYNGGGEEAFGRLIGEPALRDPDLLIRTSGEQRISNFLLWQCAYSEFVFHDALWPDFSREDLVGCLEEYAERERRFGKR